MNINNVIYLLSKEVNYDSTKVTYITFAEKELAKNLIEIISERDSLEEDYTLEIDIPTREDDEILEEKEDNQNLDAKLHKKVIVSSEAKHTNFNSIKWQRLYSHTIKN